MSRPYSVSLHIAEKNCTKGDLDKFIGILKQDHNFQLLGSSFSSDKIHQGSTLVKPISGNSAETVYEGTKKTIGSNKYRNNG